MPYLCIRVDLDYVPWDTPDAQDFGHGEPAMVIRLLQLAEKDGLELHFFASNRTLRAFPATVSAILDSENDLDWLSKHPRQTHRFEEALRIFEMHGHVVRGIATRDAWPSDVDFSFPPHVEFVSSPPGPFPNSLSFFPVETRIDRDATRAGATARTWSDKVKLQLRDSASRNVGATIVVRPQVLMQFDPKLAILRELIEFGVGIDLKLCTLRNVATSN